jgi:hypothetical protein
LRAVGQVQKTIAVAATIAIRMPGARLRLLRMRIVASAPPPIAKELQFVFR